MKKIKKVKSVKDMNWRELRDYDVPYLETKEELSKAIEDLIDRKHDYNTSAEILSIVAVLAVKHVCARMGSSSYQYGTAMTEIARKMSNAEVVSFINYDNLLYPQCDHLFERRLPQGAWNILKRKAKKKMREDVKMFINFAKDAYKKGLLTKEQYDYRMKNPVAKDVYERWKLLADGKLPDGWEVTTY